ncbi:MAG: DUF3131 domain-containing protein [Maritimibacter sp.]|nr:DUF3131 domain-containing protein [Maritimibacter sp.]
MMRRRSFLQLSAAAAAETLARPTLARTAGPATAALVIDGIGPATDAARLFALLETFLETDLWVTCAVRLPAPGTDAGPMQLRQLAALGPGVEIALDQPDLGRLSPYFQARAAFDARRRLAEIAGGPMELRSLVCDPVDAPRDPTGVRSAGVRNVLVRPEASAPTRSESWQNGVARFRGGERLTPRSAGIASDPAATTRLFYLGADSLAGLDDAALRGWARTLAERLRAEELAGRLSVMPVSDIQLRDDFDFARYVAIELDGPGEGPLGALANRLAERGIAATLRDDGLAPGYWLPEAEGPDAAQPVALGEIGCDAEGRLTLAGAAPGTPGLALRPGSADAGAGLDDCAVLTLPRIAIDRPLTRDEALLPPTSQSDVILAIGAEAIATRRAEDALIAAIAALAEDGITRFVSIPEMAAALIVTDPVDQRFRRTEAARLAAADPVKTYTPEEIAAYRDDAARAFAYIETFTDPTTGLCPATVDITAPDEALTYVTMWDVGSQINGLVAARRIGLIAPDPFETAIRKVLAQIAGRRSQDRLLPQGVIRTDRDRWGDSDFDGCDGGRLLASLDGLRRYDTLAPEVAALVDSWDLDKVVVDKVIYSVKETALVSTYQSHCAHYAGRAFGRWGIEVATPYQTMDGRTPADGEMALLEATAGIGPLGAEPLLLEALELGMSPESAYLADVLYRAQVEEFEATGDLIAVGETPIKERPWFIYLGLQLGREAREWAIDVVGGDPQYQSKAFLDKHMAVSSKAAYLWAAYRPGAYADALVAHVRDRARLDVGFASNVNRATGEAARNYTDLNTNGIILEAIAKILEDAGALSEPAE